jgi:hypothetical protein
MPVDFTGTWTAALRRSRFLGPVPAGVTVHIEHVDPELREEILVTRVDGREERAVFACRTDGEPGNSLLNDRAVRGCARWEGSDLVIESWATVGPRQVHVCDRWSLSPDGQTLTMEHRDGDLAGQLTVLGRAG